MHKKRSYIKPVMAYLTEDEFQKLNKYTKEQEISYNKYLRQGLNLKFNQEGSSIDRLTKQSDKVIANMKKRIVELTKQEEKTKYDNWVGKKTYFNSGDIK